MIIVCNSIFIHLCFPLLMHSDVSSPTWTNPSCQFTAGFVQISWNSPSRCCGEFVIKKLEHNKKPITVNTTNETSLFLPLSTENSNYTVYCQLAESDSLGPPSVPIHIKSSKICNRCICNHAYHVFLSVHTLTSCWIISETDIESLSIEPVHVAMVDQDNCSVTYRITYSTEVNIMP